jgi:uncharacterized protein (UPF0264 family)
MARLLVSVRNAVEAATALAGGAALVDVKEPALGSLGRAADAVHAEVRATIAGRVSMSVALGELRDGIEPLPDLTGITYAKWGLAGCLGLDWQEVLRQGRQAVEQFSSCRVVMTAYADCRRANAPAPLDVCHFAAHEQAAALLLDTWHKDGSTLLDWLSVAAVTELVQRSRACGVKVALAGALGARQIEALLPAGPDWFAVRSAVCARGERAGTLDGARVAELVALCLSARSRSRL